MTDTLFDKKQSFLLNMLSSGKHKYKPYQKSPIRYAGGKSRAVGYIIEHIPSHITDIVSPFIGGGSVEIACSKEFGINVIGYDVFELLTNYWYHQINHQDALYDILSSWKSTRDQYDINKQRLKDYWTEYSNEKITSNHLELAALYWFNHNLSYGPGFLGWISSIYECEKRYEKAINKVKDFSGVNLSVFGGTFDNVLVDNNNTFLYCDPPYYLDDGKMFRGIYPQRNFPIHHKGFDHENLRNLLHNHQNGFILSYNDCDTIREWYRDFDIHEVAWQYSMGQGETRIGKNRIENGTNHVKKSHELLIVKKG